eukprot:2206931-Rhodomonas_salina.2
MLRARARRSSPLPAPTASAPPLPVARPSGAVAGAAATDASAHTEVRPQRESEKDPEQRRIEGQQGCGEEDAGSWARLGRPRRSQWKRWEW